MISLELLLNRYFGTESFDLSLPERIFSGVRLLPGNVSSCSDSYLYLTNNLTQRAEKKLPKTVTVLNFVFEKEFSAPQARGNVITIPIREEYPAAVNRIQEFFQEFFDWTRELDFASFRNATYQEFVTIGNEMIDAPILIYDPALKLLAWSDRPESRSDPFYQNAVEKGYLDVRAFTYLSDAKAFEELHETGISRGMPDELRKHADYIKELRVNDELLLYCVLLVTGGTRHDYTCRLFDLFCDSLYNMVEQQYRSLRKDRSVADYFLLDLLNNPDTPADQIQERLQYHDLAYFGSYIILTLVMRELQNTAKYFIQHLRNSMLNAHVFQYHNNIIILYAMKPQQLRDYRRSLSGQFEQILGAFHGQEPRLFVSKPFMDMSQFSNAYRQTESCCKLKNDTGELITFYEDLWMEDFFAQNCLESQRFTFCEYVISDLLQQNTKKASQRLAILYEYLRHERNLTAAAAKLQMHRNNVSYHIDKLVEKYNLHLDDPDVRMRLLLSFEIARHTVLFPE